MPIDNLSKITSRSGINTTILLEAGNANVTGIVTAAGFDGPFTGGSGSDINAGMVTARDGLHVGAGGTILYALSEDDGAIGLNNTTPSTQYYNNLVVGNNNAGSWGITVRTNSANSGNLAFSDTDSANAGRYDGRVSYEHTDQSMRFHTNAAAGGTTEKLRITSDGHVGINSSSPTNTLVVQESTDNNSSIQLFRASTGGDIASINWATNQGNQAKINYRGAAPSGMQFYTGGGGDSNLRMLIDPDGNVGIGTNEPNDKLSIHSAANSLVLGAKETTSQNHIFQLLADDSAGNGELRLYRNSGSGTHEKTVEIASSGDTYFMGGDVGIGTDSISQPLNIRRSSVGQAEFGVRLEYENLTGPTVTSAAVLVNGNGLQFRNYNSSRTFIFNGGHVGIGTLVPTAPRFSSTVSGLLHLRGTKPSLYISEQDNHDPDGKERAIFVGLSGGSAFIGSNGDDGLQLLTGNGSTGAAVQITQDKYVHFGNTGHGTNKVGGQAVTGNDFDPYFKILSNTSNSWSMQIRNDTNTGSNGMFLRAGNDNTSTYTLYATGTNEHYPSFVVRGDGNVGIGSSSPAERLQIFGNIELNAYDNSNGQQGYYSPKGFIIGNAFDNGVGNACTDDRTAIIWQERGLDLDIGVNNAFHTKFNYQGRVGIAHSAPNARLHIGALGTGSAVGDATNPAFQIGNTTNYRFAIHTTSEGAIIANKNGDDGIQIHTKLGNTGNSGIGEAQRFHSRGYRESRNYNYGPWAFTNNTTKTTITVGDPGDNKFTTIKLILTLRDVSYRQGLWQGEFTIFASNATGGPGVNYYLKKLWDHEGSSNWSGGTVSVSITSSGALQFTADNGHDDANGNAYIHILDVIGDIDGSTVASISS